MSEKPLLRIGRLTLTPVAAIAPKWGLRLMRPSRHYGLMAEIDTPQAQYELRWNERRQPK